VNKRFRTCDFEQQFLLPPSLQDWLPESHLARFIADIVDELDLSDIYLAYERKDGRGLAAYHPLLLTRLLLYGYCIGVTSSRRIERATYEDVAFRYLAVNQHPDHDTIAAFRQRHLQALAGLFVQALRLCQKAGLVKLGNVAIDGTKIMANASTRRSVPYQKLAEREQYWKETVERLLLEAQATDRQEDQRWGKGQAADPLPPELANAQSRLERIRQAKHELEEEARQQLESAKQKHPPRRPGRPTKEEAARRPRKDSKDSETARKQLQRAVRNAKHPARQYNFVDPDSRIMKDMARKSFVQAYNAQAAADSHAQVIVAAEITQEVVDCHQLLPMVAAVIQATGSCPDTVTADAGYWDTAAVGAESLAGIQVLVTPDAFPRSALPPRSHKTHNEVATLMRERLMSKEGKALYARRKAVIEPVFAQIKEIRNIRRFRFRGLQEVAAEWKLICATHNFLKLYRHRIGSE
jgi:transposase